ncbi:MAG TPA: hypothetical protein VD966_10730 [Pyrinomonadaceae bacterium]|nr:hypothetical protein [Pyrinomonadaceae bacterium]
MSGKAGKLTEEEIDEIVMAQADDDDAWEESVHVRRPQAAISLPSELASRAAFFARLHREAGLEDWVKRVIQERIDMEEAAFAELKRDLAKK